LYKSIVQEIAHDHKETLEPVWAKVIPCTWPYTVKFSWPFHDPMPTHILQCYEITLRWCSLEGLQKITWKNQVLRPISSPQSIKKKYLSFRAAKF